MAGGNIRLALDLIRGFFGSGHVNTEKIVNIYVDEGSYYVPLHEFLRAVIFGDNVYYDPDKSLIANLFDVSYVDAKEHFLLPLLIGLLASTNSPSNEDGFVEISKVYERLQGLGFTPEQIDSAVIRGHSKSLIETGARRIPQPNRVMPHALRATTIGFYHIQRLCRLFQYIDAIIVDTPIFDEKARSLITDEHKLEHRLNRSEEFIKYLDRCWESLEGLNADFIFNWKETSKNVKSEIEYIRRKNLI